ncbi:MAG: periplasmic heavy metal sensor [Acidobacteria bacterium]|nr:periplasmic heavy metal sensor [Acidobacteriota bacterium]
MLRYALAFLITLLPALAQMPRGVFNWWDSPIAKDLNLTEDQTRQIRTIVKEHRGKLIDLRASVEKAEAEFEDVFNEDSFDQRRANDSLERLVTARADLMRDFSQMSLRLRAVLTPEQYRELQKRRPRLLRTEERRQMRGPAPGPGGQGGPGVPGGPGPRPSRQNPPPPPPGQE